jgi:hypothetical protein
MYLLAIHKLIRLINTYRPLKRISPLAWIDAGRLLDEKEISAVTLPVTIDHPPSENMLQNPSQIRAQRFIKKYLLSCLWDVK